MTVISMDGMDLFVMKMSKLRMKNWRNGIAQNAVVRFIALNLVLTHMANRISLTNPV